MLRLEVLDRAGPARWRWRLTRADGGAFLADHRVDLRRSFRHTGLHVHALRVGACHPPGRSGTGQESDRGQALQGALHPQRRAEGRLPRALDRQWWRAVLRWHRQQLRSAGRVLGLQSHPGRQDDRPQLGDPRHQSGLLTARTWSSRRTQRPPAGARARAGHTTRSAIAATAQHTLQRSAGGEVDPYAHHPGPGRLQRRPFAGRFDASRA